MQISDMYDITRIVRDIETALCIDGVDYGEKDIDTIVENVTNRIIVQHQIDLHGRTLTDDVLYVGRARSSTVLFVENLAFMHARLCGYSAAIVRYNRRVTIRPVNINYMGFTTETLKSFFMAAQMEATMPSINTAISAIGRKFGSVNSCIEKQIILIMIVAYRIGAYELVAGLAEIMYMGMQA